MSKRNHKKSGSHGHSRVNETKSGSNKFHKDWRVWVAVGIMLAAILMYVVTLDESVVPAIMTQ